MFGPLGFAMRLARGPSAGGRARRGPPRPVGRGGRAVNLKASQQKDVRPIENIVRALRKTIAEQP